MKRFFFLLLFISTLAVPLMAQDYSDEYEDEDTYDEVYVYDSNGAGDRFLKISVGALFPLNFKQQLNVGGELSIGFYQFISKTLALGGEFTPTYSQTIGDKVLVMFPITFGIMYQPYISKFEFPMFAEIGIANQTWQNMEIFPTFVSRLSAGAYYRITDSVSIGVSTDFLWIPQWFKDTSKNFNGLFETAAINLRYHF